MPGAEWIVPIGVALVGIVGQWGIGAFYAGRMDERVHLRGDEIRDEKIAQGRAAERLDNHEGRISHLEGRTSFGMEKG